jgi:hypothetical protein
MHFAARYGWTAQVGSASLREPEANRHPVLRLEKGELWAETHGERGMDPQIMYERALIEALRLELSQADEGTPPALPSLVTGWSIAPADVTTDLSGRCGCAAVHRRPGSRPTSECPGVG